MSKPQHNVHACCAHAADVLRAAGFERAHVSLRSEAVYFRFPGRHGLLRVASHKFRGGMIGMDWVVAKLTFRGNHHCLPDTICCSDEKIDGMIYRAIGEYMIRSATERAPNYDGKRGTWEQSRSSSTGRALPCKQEDCGSSPQDGTTNPAPQRGRAK